MGIPHVPFYFGLGNERGHGVDHQNVYGAAAYQHFCYFQGLLTGIGLGNEQVVRFHSELSGVADIEGVLKIIFGV